MESTQNQVLPRRKSYWTLFKAMFIPAHNIAKLMRGCGGKNGKGKRRLSLKNMQQARAAFVRTSLQRVGSNTIQTPQRRAALNTLHENDVHPVGNLNTEMNSRTQSSYVDASVVVHTEIILGEANIPEQTSVPLSCNSPTAAPLNLEEAQCLLESLTLHCQSQPNQADRIIQTFPSPILDISVDDNDLGLNADHCTVSSEVHESDTINNDGNGETNLIEDDEAFEHICVDNVQNVSCNDDSISRSLRSTSLSSSGSATINPHNENVNLRRTSNTTVNSRPPEGEHDYSGWKKSYIEVTSNPPVTLGYLPCGLCIGDRVVWVNDDHPEIGTVRWIGKIRQQFYAGIEFDKPVGNSSGIYGYGIGLFKRLFTCQLPYGRFVPVKELVLYRDYHDPGVKCGIVCIICRDDFLDTWDVDATDGAEGTALGDDLQPFNMVSTKCGHLYHWGCLHHWFNTKKQSEFRCPFCSTALERTDIIRIFPSQA